MLKPELDELTVAHANLSRLIEVEAFGYCRNPVCCPPLALEGLLNFV